MESKRDKLVNILIPIAFVLVVLLRPYQFFSSLKGTVWEEIWTFAGLAAVAGLLCSVYQKKWQRITLATALVVVLAIDIMQYLEHYGVIRF